MADDSVTKDMGTLLAANGFGTVGTSIFEGLLPPRVTPLIALFDTRGLKPVRTATKLVACEKPGLMVQVKNLDYETGYGIAQSIRRFLQGFKGAAGTGTYLDINATTTVLNMGQVDDGSFLFSINFMLMRVSS